MLNMLYDTIGVVGSVVFVSGSIIILGLPIWVPVCIAKQTGAFDEMKDKVLTKISNWCLSKVSE